MILEPLLTLSLAGLHGFLLISVRVLALLLTMPILREGTIPRPVKALLAAAVALLLVPWVSLPHPPAEHELQFAIQLVGEALVGIAIGFAMQLLLEGLRLAGELLEVQVGLSFNLGDPGDPLGATLTGQLYYIIAGILFLLSGAHRMALAGIVESFQLVPPGAAWLNPMIAHPHTPYGTQNLIDVSAGMFVVAIKIAAPIVVTMLVATFVFGLVSRTMPQLNIFIVSYPIRIVVGFALLLVGLPLVARLVTGYLHGMPDVASAMIRHLIRPQGGF